MVTDLVDILQGGASAAGDKKSHAALADVGAITKTDGVEGAVLVKLASGEDNDIFDEEFLIVMTGGAPVPMRIEECQRRGDRSATIRLKRIFSQSQAEQLVGCRVMALMHNDEDEDGYGPDSSIIGFSLSDETQGHLGTIDDIDDRVLANPLFVVNGPYGEVLVPAVEEFIVSIDDSTRTVVMDLPEGLVALNDGNYDEEEDEEDEEE